MKAFIGTILFYIFLVINTLSIMPVVIIALFLPGSVMKNTACWWNKVNLFLLKYCCGIDYKIEGLSNISKKTALYVAKHQSMYETFLLYNYLRKPAFIVKKELLYLPVFGWGMHKADFIIIDRKKGKESIEKIERQVKKLMKKGQSVVIFPEGTRVPFGKISGYKSGAYGVYSAMNGKIDVIPIALNTGKFWGKGQFVKKPGTVIVKIMPPIQFKKNVDKKEFIGKIEETIEIEQKKF